MNVLRLPQVLARVGLSRSSVYALIAEDRFPAAIPLGTRARGWLEEEVSEWIEQRVRARGAAQGQQTERRKAA